jgi:hypothetical protein
VASRLFALLFRFSSQKQCVCWGNLTVYYASLVPGASRPPLTPLLSPTFPQQTRRQRNQEQSENKEAAATRLRVFLVGCLLVFWGVSGERPRRLRREAGRKMPGADSEGQRPPPDERPDLEVIVWKRWMLIVKPETMLYIVR